MVRHFTPMPKDRDFDPPHERRRLKIISNEFGETPVLKLMFGALCASAERRRGLRFTELELRQIAAVRKDISGEYEAAINSISQAVPKHAFQRTRLNRSRQYGPCQK